MERGPARCDLDAGVGQIQPVHVAGDEAHVREPAARGLGARQLEEGVGGVDAQHVG